MSDHRVSGVRARSSEPRDRASWTLAPSVHQADIDHGAWSSRRGDQHAYPPLCSAAEVAASVSWAVQNESIWRIIMVGANAATFELKTIIRLRSSSDCVANFR